MFKPTAVVLCSREWVAAAALVALLSYGMPSLLAWLAPMLPPHVSELKPYADLRAFRKHYETEHQDDTSVTLHVTGTSLVLLAALQHPELIVAGVLAAQCGQIAFAAFRHLDDGLAEALVALVVFFGVTRFLRGSIAMALAVLICGYTFAWTGHFFFEGNRPATFIYPTFSLISDFLLWAEVILGIQITL